MKRSRLTSQMGLLLVWSLAANAWCTPVDGTVKTRTGAPAGPVRFAVISDPHLHDARLGTSGSAFEAYLDQDPKLIKESEPILESALASIVEQGVQFIIIPGDLAKDGELRNHVLMTRHLQKLEQAGIEVYVVPGNHDINNPNAERYLGETTRPVPLTSPETFRAIYTRFGYGQAIAHDADSLSYVAEPVPGLWLLAIDSCKYQENLELGRAVIGGRISAETMTWIEARLHEAQAKGKQVIAFMHHGVNQHFLPEPILFPDWLLDDWPIVSAQLAAAGLKVVFTGHYHSQDAAYPVGEAQPTLCDVETASLVQYPCAFRIVTVDGTTLNIQSERVTQINADTGGLPFQQFVEDFLRTRLLPLVIEELVELFGVPRDDAALVAPPVVDALVANYAGDEAPSPDTLAMIAALVSSSDPFQRTLGELLWGFWADLLPEDNNLVVPFAWDDNS